MQFVDMLACKTTECVDMHYNFMKYAEEKFKNDPNFRDDVINKAGDYLGNIANDQFITGQYEAFVPLTEAAIDECKSNSSDKCRQYGIIKYLLKNGSQEKSIDFLISLCIPLGYEKVWVLSKGIIGNIISEARDLEKYIVSILPFIENKNSLYKFGNIFTSIKTNQPNYNGTIILYTLHFIYPTVMLL